MLTSVGNNTWIQQIADTFLSNSQVSAQSSSTQKKTFSENISLQFFVDENYTTTVEGVIELVNVSGKDISLTQYDMDLPYFTLKNTRIGYVYPNAFLVDMYSRNNSILFTFKSQYTKPVVVGKNARITFTFSAKVEKPFYAFGGMRVLIFPYALAEEGREVRITVSLNSKLPVVAAPQVAPALKQKGIFPVTNDFGKVFVFANSVEPYSASFSHSAEIPLPAFGTNNCITFQPVSCVGCGDVVVNGLHNEMAAQRNKSAKSLVFQIATSIDSSCATKQFANSAIPQTAGRTFRAGFVLSPMTNQLIPATWRVHESETGTYATSFLARGVPYFYADPYGFLSIPLFSCSSDDDCRAKADALQTIETSLLSSFNTSIPGVTSDLRENTSVGIIQQHRQFYLHIKNTSDQFLQIDSILLEANPFFTLSSTTARLIPPQTSIDLPLTTKSTIQSSNRDATIQGKLNGEIKNIRFKPIKITLLAIIEMLAYLFIASIGVTVVSLLGLIVYTQYYEKRKRPVSP